LEAVKEQLMPFLQRKKVQTMLENLRKQAKVEILVPLTDEKPKAPAVNKAVTGQPVIEETVEEVEVKDASGKTVEKEIVIDEKLVEEKAPAKAEAAPAATKKTEEAKKPAPAETKK
jgi:peptidyl-prolyl cis-trans isomerase C